MSRKNCRNNTKVFFVLLRAGQWQNVNKNDNFDENLFRGLGWGEVQKLAEEQSVVGLVTAGVEGLSVCGIPLTDKLTLLGKCQLLEQRNAAMNNFVAELVQKLHETGIKAVLLKGQGVAQCYAKPQWRLSGDVDLLLDEENYKKAKDVLLPIASDSGKEFEYNQHQSLTIGLFTIELHGSQRCGLSSRMDAVIDEVQQDIFENGKVRTWMNSNVPVNLPAPDEDVILVFTHFLKHFYKGGLGLKQICDWCRLLWTYRGTIDLPLLESRLREMRLVSEWKAFAAFAVVYLGMPIEAMPLYSSEKKWKRKSKRICSFIMGVGNMGHNRDMSYYNTKPYLIQKVISLRYRCVDLLHHMAIFPLDSIRFFPRIMINGLRSAARGE